MKRGAVVALSLLACSSLPAFAQNPGSLGNSELAGAPGWRTGQDEAAKRAAARRQVEDQIAEARARTRLQADQAAAAKRAEARKAEEARLAKQQAEDRKALDASRRSLAEAEARLRTKEEELAAEETRLAKLRAEIEAETDAEAGAGSDEPDFAAAGGALADRPSLERREDRRGPMRLDASIRSCGYAGEDKAVSRDYVSARYVRPPRFFERRGEFDGVWELRGVMRVEDRRGAILADTVCELDEDGEVIYFGFVR